MNRITPLLLVSLLAACQNEDDPTDGLDVPSGREVSLIEVITNAPGPAGATARFRFLAPGLSQDEVESAAVDMQALCDSYALPRTDGMVPVPQQIIISFSGEAVPFGEAAPDVVQFFESYSIVGTSCVWEQF